MNQVNISAAENKIDPGKNTNALKRKAEQRDKLGATGVSVRFDPQGLDRNDANLD